MLHGMRQHHGMKPDLLTMISLFLQVGLDLKKSVHNMYKETIVRMETALLSVCNDFRPDEYRRVSLAGLLFVGFKINIHGIR